jgi:lysophospholipase L1-like esterase
LHVVLLGDSTLDNGLYTGGGPAVIDHLRRELEPAAAATLLAEDGNQTWDVAGQLEGIPTTATHLILSVGGNDALNVIDVLSRPAQSVGHALAQLTGVLAEFDRNYRQCLDRVLSHALPTVVCTIYNGAFEDPSEQQIISTALRLFDDVVMEAAIDAGCPILDLRKVCDAPAHYWDPIEPSETGGHRIAQALAHVLRGDWNPESTVYPSAGHAL